MRILLCSSYVTTAVNPLDIKRIESRITVANLFIGFSFETGQKNTSAPLLSFIFIIYSKT